MPTRRLDTDELWRRGDDWYNNHIRARVEVPGNLGKLIHIDVESGDYEVGTDRDAAQMSQRLITKNADAQIVELRIGYPAVSVLPFPRPKLGKSL